MKDLATLESWLPKIVKDSGKEHHRAVVTAVGLIVAPYPGYVTIAFDTGNAESPWEAAFPDYAAKDFDRWGHAAECYDEGVNIVQADGTLYKKKLSTEKQFQRPFFDMGVRLIQSQTAKNAFRLLSGKSRMRICVDTSEGHHSKRWIF